MENIFTTIRKALTAILTFCLVMPQSVWALPTGANVVSGTATVSTPTSTQMNINQSTNKAIIEYNSFSIASNEAVRIAVPTASGVTLNRVVGLDPSSILGRLSSNGSVFVVNPNGVVFGDTAIVDVNGLVASTLDISNDDFNAGDLNFQGNGSNGSVINRSTIRTPGGYAALLGSSVQNEGVIFANMGSVVLASGKAMTVNLDPAGTVSVAVTDSTSNNPGATAAVSNTGLIRANGGQVVLTADVLNGLFDQAVNSSGIIEATDASSFEGVVKLTASGGDILTNGGIAGGDILISNETGNITLRGNIESSGEDIVINATNGDVTHGYTSSVKSNGGNIKGSAGGTYTVRNSAVIDAGSGIIDLLGIGDLIIGSTDTTDVGEAFWRYLTGERGASFLEFGYYYRNTSGDVVYVTLSSGADIGRDGVSPTNGTFTLPAGVSPSDIELYADFNTVVGGIRWHEDVSLNSDASNHFMTVAASLFGIEDTEEPEADSDFQDAIVMRDFVATSSTVAPIIKTTGNMFLTSQTGSITQIKGDIEGGNVALSAATGITGNGSNGGICIKADQVSALNTTSGDLKIETKENMVVADLSGLTGLNSGVTGHNGVTNQVADSTTDLKANGDLTVVAPIETWGDTVLTATGNIVQEGPNGNIEVHQEIDDPWGPPTNLISTTNLVGVPDTPNPIGVQWQLPDSGLNNPRSLTINAGGSYTQNVGTSADTHGGDITVTAADDIRLSLLDAHLGNVSVTSTDGSIIDNDLQVAPQDYDVIAKQITLSAPNGSVGGASPDEIDLGAPNLGFSYEFDNVSVTDPDNTVDPYTAFLNSNGEWTYETFLTVPDESLPWWFHVATVNLDLSGPPVSTPVHIGPFIFPTLSIDTTSSPDAFAEFLQLFPAYYEILDPNQFYSFEPLQPVGLYAYHPIDAQPAPGAFSDITLDVEAFEFIDQQLEDEEERRQ